MRPKLALSSTWTAVLQIQYKVPSRAPRRAEYHVSHGTIATRRMLQDEPGAVGRVSVSWGTQKSQTWSPAIRGAPTATLSNSYTWGKRTPVPEASIGQPESSIKGEDDAAWSGGELFSDSYTHVSSEKSSRPGPVSLERHPAMDYCGRDGDTLPGRQVPHLVLDTE